MPFHKRRRNERTVVYSFTKRICNHYCKNLGGSQKQKNKKQTNKQKNPFIAQRRETKA
jgi:hypothetical protein